MSLLPTSSCHEPVLSCHRFLRSWWFHDTETSQALRSKQVLAWLYIRSDSESVDPAFNGCNERSEIRAVGRGRVKLVHTQDGYGLVLGDVFSRNYDPHIYNKIEVFFRSGYYLLQLKGTWRRTTQTEDGNIFRNFCRFCNCWLTVYIYIYIYPELMRISVGVFRAQRFTYYLHEWSELPSAPTELGQKYQWQQYKTTDLSSLNWSLRWKWMCI